VDDVRPSVHLPVLPTPMIGRERELAEVVRLLREDGVRLLTLTGPPGVGKTRLGLAVAAELRDAYANGVVFVNLVPLRDAGLVGATIVRSLGLQEARGKSASEVLTAYLRRKQMLLVLDNFEHLLEAVALVGELLGACPDLSVLVTSRWALEMRAEHLFEVPVLACPPPGRSLSGEKAMDYAAVRLFVERARAVQQDFRLHADIVPAVTRICKRLDGLPLAIVLAAPWTRVLSPMALQTRLEHRVLALVADTRDRLGRQQTLRETLAWSYELLEEDEQQLLSRLGVFLGGSSLEAIEAICCTDGQIDAIRVIGSLVNKSLVHVETDASGERRFVLLEMVREYALERLDDSGESEALKRSHAAYYLDLALRAEPELRGPRQGEWLSSLDLEHDNLRAALQWALAKNELLLGLRAAGALWHFWWARGHLSEGRTWLGELLARDRSDRDNDEMMDLARAPQSLREPRSRVRSWSGGMKQNAARAAACIGAGVLASYQGDVARGAVLLEESVALYRQLEDRLGLASALAGLGDANQWLGDYGRSQALLEESVALYRDLADKQSSANALNKLGSLLQIQGKNEQAIPVLEESLTLCRELGDTTGRAIALNTLGEVARAQGELERSATLYEESLSLHRQLGTKGAIATVLANLGLVALARGELDRALALCSEALADHWALGDSWSVAYDLEGIASVVAAKGQPKRATMLLASAEATREATRTPLPPSERRNVDQTVALLRATLERGRISPDPRQASVEIVSARTRVNRIRRPPGCGISHRREC
jgi:predicted ATPase